MRKGGGMERLQQILHPFSRLGSVLCSPAVTVNWNLPKAKKIASSFDSYLQKIQFTYVHE
jgi:hypothetical protein